MRQGREVWRERVAHWRASGLTAREFAARHGFSANTLSWWRWQLGRAVPVREEEKAAAIVEVVATPVDGRLELVVGDRRIRVPVNFDEDTLRRLLSVLEDAG
jgi:hypothetical protein